MATTYEVRMTLDDRDSPSGPLAAILNRTLADSAADEVTLAKASVTEPGRLLVRMSVDAIDASAASLTARDALLRAVTDVGLSESAVTLGAPEVRASS